MPLNEAAIAAAVSGIKSVLIVDECRRTGSQSEALVTLLVEHLAKLPRIKRVTAEDCFIPLGKAATVLLPSKEAIVAAALEVTQSKVTKSKVTQSKRK